MQPVELFKWIDKVVGTPLCVILGFLFNNFFIKKLRTKNLSLKKILIIKLVAIGDVVIALPTVKAIKKNFPQAHLCFLLTPRVIEVLEDSPYIDEIICYDIFGKDKGIGGLLRIIKKIREKRFTTAIELDHYYRLTTLITFFSGIPHRIGFDLPKQGRRLLYTKKVKYAVNKHEVEVFLSVLEQLDRKIEEEDKKLVELQINEEDKEKINIFFKENNIDIKKDKIVIIHVGSGKSAQARRWSSEKFAKLADFIIDNSIKVIFTGIKEELMIYRSIKEKMKNKEGDICGVGKFNLKEFAALCKVANLFIGVDSGPLHVAAAMNTPIIGLYGPNTPLKWGPYNEKHIVIYKNLRCSPCTKQYLGKISKCKKPICMESIEVEEVKEAVCKLLNLV